MDAVLSLVKILLMKINLYREAAMIEIIYKEETEAEEVNVKLPRNIKQVGNGGGTRKVYIEDYAAGFIKMHPEAEEEYRYGVLLGKIQRSGIYTYVFVKGAVEAAEHKSIRFDDEIWTCIYEDIKQNFTEGDIIGWFLNAPMMERDRRMALQKIHLDNFAGNDKICFFFDRAEKQEAIYSYDSGMMQKRHGYYVFYEKNPEMQNYMVASEKNETENSSNIKISGGSINSRNNKLPDAQEVRRMGKIPSFLYSASSFLVIAVLVATIALMNNYGQMKKLKGSIEQIADRMSVMQPGTEEAAPEAVDANNQPETAKIENVPGEVDTTPADAEPQTSADEQAAVQPETDTTSAPAGTEYNYYTVQKGETLSTICQKIYGTQDKKAEVMKANGISDENMIYIGQKIILP